MSTKIGFVGSPGAPVGIVAPVVLPSALLAVLLSVLFAAPQLRAQTVQPVIVEYQQKADGRIEVTNSTLQPMAVVLEPRSFSISEDGRGIYRPIDPSIHLKLSTTSFLLGPQQTYYVFYKATADTLPAWFTVYAGFTQVGASAGLKVRFMLPHTVYLYQKQPLDKASIHVANAAYRSADNKVVCDIRNDGAGLVRVEEVRAVGDKSSVEGGGFPLLPGASRHLAIDWKERGSPTAIVLHFPRFEVKEAVSPQGP
jgi:hypothetical protein